MKRRRIRRVKKQNIENEKNDWMEDKKKVEQKE